MCVKDIVCNVSVVFSETQCIYGLVCRNRAEIREIRNITHVIFSCNTSVFLLHVRKTTKYICNHGAFSMQDEYKGKAISCRLYVVLVQ